MPIVSTGQITIIDVNDGVDGLDGPALAIQASKAGFTYEDGVAVPTVQAIAFAAYKQGISDPVVWSVSDGMTLDSDNGVVDITSYAFGIPAAGEGNTVYLDLADFGSLRLGSVLATAGGLSSFTNILRVDKSTAAANATRNVFVGNWATANAYVVGDVVLKDGYGWSCIQNHVSSGSVMPPTYPTTSNAYWTAYALKGDQGVTGTRGTITTSAATAGTVWVDAEANTAISTAGGGSPLAGDVVTLYNSASAFSQTRVRTSGGAWAALAAFFGGDVLVDGTLGAVKLAANSVTANKIAAGAVTASKISVGDFAVQARNWDFEEGDTQWAKESGWAVVSDVANAKSGTWVARNTNNASGTALRNSQKVAVEAGETFYAEAYIKHAASSAGTGTRVRCIGYNAAVNTEVQFAVGAYVTAATTTYTKSSVSFTVGAGVAFIDVEVESVLTAGSAFADEVRLFRTSNTTLIADGAITAAKITANTITAGQIAANTITASRLLIADLSNIVPDADMADSNSWSAPTAWETPPSASWRGSRVARLDGAASAYTVLSGKVFPVEAGAALHFSYQGQVLAGTGGAFGGQIMLSAATDMSTPSYIGGANSTSTTLVTYAGNVTVPAGMKYARVQLFKLNDAATSVRVGGVVVRRAANAELIVDGAISAAKISAGAITTDKLLVTGQGTAINPDPNTTDISAWDGIGISIVADTASPTGSALAITSQGATTYTKRFALDASKNYDLRMTMRRVSGTATTYLLVAFFDANDAAIPASTYGVGWPYGGSFHYFGLAGVVGPTSYTEYRISFGPDETPKIPPGAKYARVGMLANYSGGAGEQRFTSIRLAEKASADLIVDGAISATKLAAGSIAVGTAAIANGAIVNAMIGTAAIDSVKISDAAITTAKIGDAQITNAKIDTLSAAKITTGTLDAARIGANSITATMIDSTGLSIKNGSGVVIFSSGVPLAATNMAPVANENLLTLPHTFASNWTYSNGSLTASNVEDRLGGITGSRLTLSATSADLYRQMTGLKVGSTYRLNIWYKRETPGSNFVITLNNAATWNTGESSANTGDGWNLATAKITTNTGNINIHIGAHSNTGTQQIAGAVLVSHIELVETSPYENSNISISAAGTLSGAGGGTVTLPGIGLQTYRVIAWGNSATTQPASGNFYNADTGAVLVGPANMYRVVKINRSTGVVTNVGGWNTLAGAPNPANMAAALNAIGNDHVVVVFSYDEPQGNRLTGGLDTAMYRCGASRAVFGSPTFQYRSAYILIGIPGCGEGGGTEAYAGSVSADPNAWCDVSFSVRNGNVIVGPGKTPTDIVGGFNPITSSNVSTYIADVAIGNAQIADLNATKITAGSIAAARLSVGTLSSVVNNGATTGERVVINSNQILVYDASNVIRVKIGNLA